MSRREMRFRMPLRLHRKPLEQEVQEGDPVVVALFMRYCGAGFTKTQENFGIPPRSVRGDRSRGWTRVLDTTSVVSTMRVSSAIREHLSIVISLAIVDHE